MPVNQMTGDGLSDGRPRVSPVDRWGRRIDPPVLNAAEEICRRAIQHAEKLFVDPAVAASLLEESAVAVSRALKGKTFADKPVQDLEAYLFRAFLRRLNKTMKRQLLISDALVVRAFQTRNSYDPRTLLELKILVDELLMECDPVSRDMLCRRMEEYSWKEISRAYRISTHAAQSRLGQALKRVRKKLGLHPQKARDA